MLVAHETMAGCEARRIVRALTIVFTAVVATFGADATLGASPDGKAGQGREFYIDCSRPSNGDGSREQPFNALAAVGTVRLGAGDSLLLRRGSTCVGELETRGSGAPGRPIVIGAYGGRTEALPKIEARGGNAAVAITNQSHIIVQDLDLTNSGKKEGLHRGVLLTANTGLVSDLTLRRLFIHDVDGDNTFNRGKPGGGIIGDATATGRFAGVLIEDNKIRNVSRSGIYFVGTNSRERPSADEPWNAGSTGVVMRRNDVQNVQGDGIVVLGTVGALLERNVVRYANLGGASHRSEQRNCAAGIWAFNANSTVIQHNEVTDTKFGPTPVEGCDGTGYDVDYNQDGTIVQYNLSMRNQGGFILLCADKAPHRALVRYNLSIDDGAVYSAVVCSAGTSGIPDPQVTNLREVKIYNNTFIAPTPRIIPQRDMEMMVKLKPYVHTLEFRNNLIVATASGPQNEPFDCADYCTNNLFFRMPTHGTAALSGDPQFVGPNARARGMQIAAGYRVRATSPVRGKGVPVPTLGLPPATHDFFGTPVASPPSIGFAEPVRR